MGFENVYVSVNDISETEVEIVIGNQSVYVQKSEIKDYCLGKKKNIENILYNIGVHLSFEDIHQQEDSDSTYLDIEAINTALSGKAFKF